MKAIVFQKGLLSATIHRLLFINALCYVLVALLIVIAMFFGSVTQHTAISNQLAIMLAITGGIEVLSLVSKAIRDATNEKHPKKQKQSGLTMLAATTVLVVTIVLACCALLIGYQLP